MVFPTGIITLVRGVQGQSRNEDSSMTQTLREYKAKKAAEVEKLTADDVTHMGKHNLLVHSEALMQVLFDKLRDEYSRWERKLRTAAKSIHLLRKFFCDALEALRNSSPVRLVRS